ncbi:MAG: signal recognition particle-docking protein FtsY [Eubacterium sp.]|nr:signal recognition particle-docking protein FtsY [Eubacterium sp.]
MAGFFERLKKGLTKSRNTISENMDELFGAGRPIDDDFYEELEEVLVMADIGAATASDIIERMEEIISEKKLTDAYLAKDILIDILKEKLEMPMDAYFFMNRRSVILIIGVNGVGKTTSVGKMSALLKKRGKKVLLAAADTFRAGAIEQLKEWSNRAGVDIIAGVEGQDPASIVFDAVAAAKARQTDILLCDTAGRLHNKKNLMAELHKIHTILDKEYPDAYLETLIVVDATTGQNALSQVKEFCSVTDVTGVILTKMDGTAKGGIALGIWSELGIPVKFIGVGESIEDLDMFNGDEYVNALIGEKNS